MSLNRERQQTNRANAKIAPDQEELERAMSLLMHREEHENMRRNMLADQATDPIKGRLDEEDKPYQKLEKQNNYQPDRCQHRRQALQMDLNVHQEEPATSETRKNLKPAKRRPSRPTRELTLLKRQMLIISLIWLFMNAEPAYPQRALSSLFASRLLKSSLGTASDIKPQPSVGLSLIGLGGGLLNGLTGDGSSSIDKASSRSGGMNAIEAIALIHAMNGGRSNNHHHSDNGHLDMSSLLTAHGQSQADNTRSLLYNRPLDNRPLDNRPIDNGQLDNRQFDNRQLDNRQSYQRPFDNRQQHNRPYDDGQFEGRPYDGRQFDSHQVEDRPFRVRRLINRRRLNRQMINQPVVSQPVVGRPMVENRQAANPAAAIAAFLAAVAAGATPAAALIAAALAALVPFPTNQQPNALIRRLVIKKTVLPFVIPIPYKKGEEEREKERDIVYVPKAVHHHHHEKKHHDEHEHYENHEHKEHHGLFEHKKKFKSKLKNKFKKHKKSDDNYNEPTLLGSPLEAASNKLENFDQLEKLENVNHLDKIESLLSEQDRIQSLMDEVVNNKELPPVEVER